MVPLRRFFDPHSSIRSSPCARQRTLWTFESRLSAGGNAIGEIAVTRSLNDAAPLGAEQEKIDCKDSLFEILP